MMKIKFWISMIVFSLLIPSALFCQTAEEVQGYAIGVNSEGKFIKEIEIKNGKALPVESTPNPFVPDSFSNGAPVCTSGPQPEMVDPTTLYVAKSEDSATLYLSWNGDDPLFNIFRCYEPSFQNNPQTLASGVADTSMNVTANTTKTLECFEIGGASVVSLPTQGMGYDPIPPPSVPTTADTGLWWGDPIMLYSNYLNPIAKGNVTFMQDIPVRADSVPPGTEEYKTSATFIIPDDARGFWPVVQAHNQSSDPNGVVPFVKLFPRGISAFTDIKGVTFAPSTGNIWVAASGVVQEIDVFLHEPQPGYTYTDAGIPYISRVTTDGRILYVDGYSGVPTIYQVDVSSGASTPYASTKDSSFTRDILPRGIAVDPDGSACYIADANQNKVVKIPVGAAPGSSTIKDNWGNKTYAGFPDPCGMDVNGFSSRYVIVACNDGYIYEITGQYSTVTFFNAGSIVRSILIDKDYALANYIPALRSNEVGMTEAFNHRDLAGSGTARYLGAIIFGTSDGYLSVEADRFFWTYYHFPQRVIMNNSGQSIGYPSSYQISDRIIQLAVRGYANRPLKLTVVDPADLSPYAPDEGCLQTGCTQELPYKANDNIGNSDYGICQYNNCSDGAALTKTLYCNSSGYIIFYLKVPARYSGDNFQVEVQKTNYYGNPLSQTHVAMFSPVYTSWKRVFVERDKMFRRGGVLAADFNHSTCSPCNEIELFDWTNIAVNDSIVVFDSQYTAESGGEIRTVTNVSSPSNGKVTVALNANLGKDYLASIHPETGALDFAYGRSAGVGVLSGCDSASNQLNNPDSCFYDADMQAIEKTFNDAYVEFYGLRDGMGAAPYVPYGTADIWDFGWVWFSHKNDLSYIHSLGVETNPLAYGETLRMDPKYTPSRTVRCSLIYQKHIEDGTQPSSGACFEGAEVKPVSQGVSNHETAHQFRVNPLSTPEHCISDAWTGDGPCLMSQSMCPGVTPIKLDADVESGTTTNPGDVFDVRNCVEGLPNE